MSEIPKLVDVHDLRVSYGTLEAVKGVSLSIGPGEIFGLVGPNGAGKTSTLTCLAGLLEPAAGTVRIAGADVLAEPERARRAMGFVPDFFGVYDNLAVWEYLEFFAVAQGVPAARVEARIDEVLALTHLGDKRDALVETLSRGMRQRLCLARGLIHEPTVLVLDEPLSGLDPAGRAEDLDLFRELARAGKSVVLSSHILSDLAAIATSVGVLDGGRLVYCGPVDEARRAAVPVRTLALKVLGAVDRAAIDRALGEVRLALDGPLLTVDLPDDDEAVAAAWEALRAAGVRVIPAPTARETEQALLQLSRGAGGLTA